MGKCRLLIYRKTEPNKRRDPLFSGLVCGNWVV
jgi:hypothetical protein